MSRILSGKGWIEEYLDFIERYSESPRRWNFWSAVAAVQATLKRRVWYSHGSQLIYPNDFHVLVGRPGLGKSASISPIDDILRRANTANILSDKLTIEYILERLSKGFPTTGVGPGGGMTFGMDCSCIFFASELAVFLRYPDGELPILAELWDARPGKRQYGTRLKGLLEVDSPTPTMLAGCSPDWLVMAIPPMAVGGGFTRRVNFVYYSGEGHVRKPFPDSYQSFNTASEPFVQDLRHIAQLQGQYTLDNVSKGMFERIYNDSTPNGNYGDEATCNYMTSRWAHVIKTAIALSASRDDKMVLCKCDIEEAYNHVESVTDDVKFVFRSVGESDMVVVADKVIQFVERTPAATYKQILGHLWKDVTRDDLQVILMTLRDGGVLSETHLGGNILYSALPSNHARAKLKF